MADSFVVNISVMDRPPMPLPRLLLIYAALMVVAFVIGILVGN